MKKRQREKKNHDNKISGHSWWTFVGPEYFISCFGPNFFLWWFSSKWKQFVKKMSMGSATDLEHRVNERSLHWFVIVRENEWIFSKLFNKKSMTKKTDLLRVICKSNTGLLLPHFVAYEKIKPNRNLEQNFLNMFKWSH